jgi:CTP synthase (UTP-ammonia lyase)
MSLQRSVALVGDYKPSAPAHQAIPIALQIASVHYGVSLKAEWVPTSQIHNAEAEFAPYQGIWCVPASPYQNTQGVLDAIRFARERQVPFLGTCAGFQHALIEYARNVLGMPHTEHQETNPAASRPLISALTCSLVEKTAEIILETGSLLHRSYGTARISEEYRCSYGPNPDYENTLFARKLRVTARDPAGEIRGAELQDHTFFVGTLFQPERRALKGELPPLVRQFVGVLV